MMKLINYSDLNNKQKESYNYQKLSGVLANYGYTTYRMHDDFNGTDFLAIGVNGDVLKIQLKSRCSIDKKYLNKNILIAFRKESQWFLYPHDILHEYIIKHSTGAADNGFRSMKNIPKWLEPILSKYII